MCQQRYKGYRACGHQDPEGTLFPPDLCGPPSRQPWEPPCETKEWVCLHDGSHRACPRCEAQQPSVGAILLSYRTRLQTLLSLGVGREAVEAFRLFGAAGLDRADDERRRGPENRFYEVLLREFDRYQVEGDRLINEYLDEMGDEVDEEDEEEEGQEEEQEEEEEVEVEEVEDVRSGDDEDDKGGDDREEGGGEEEKDEED